MEVPYFHEFDNFSAAVRGEAELLLGRITRPVRRASLARSTNRRERARDRARGRRACVSPADTIATDA